MLDTAQSALSDQRWGPMSAGGAIRYRHEARGPEGPLGIGGPAR